MRFVSWNVNGLRAAVRKGFEDFFAEIDADIFAVQEIKLQAGQIDLMMDDYEIYWNYAERKGYAGVAVFTKKKPHNVFYGLNGKTHEVDGRVLTLEFDDFYFVTLYSPNSQRTLARLDYRLAWEDELYQHLENLNAQKSVIVCGDLNVAHQMIDIRNAKANIGNSGFTDEERGKLNQLLDLGLIDTLRYFHPDTEGLFTWWSYMKTVRERNIGWRIDYFLASQSLMKHVTKSTTLPDIMGSDHCPIMMEMDTRF